MGTQQQLPSLRSKAISEVSDPADNDTNQAQAPPSSGIRHHTTVKLEDHFHYWED